MCIHWVDNWQRFLAVSAVHYEKSVFQSTRHTAWGVRVPPQLPVAVNLQHQGKVKRATAPLDVLCSADRLEGLARELSAVPREAFETSLVVVKNVCNVPMKLLVRVFSPKLQLAHVLS